MQGKPTTKLQKIKERKQKEKEMKMIMKSLQQNQLSEQQLDSMKSITHQGVKQRLNREEQREPSPVPISAPVVEASKVNIFQTTLFQQTIERPEEVQPQQSQMSERMRLENEAKKLMPDLTFETFDGKRVSKKAEYTVTIREEDLYDTELSYDDLTIKRFHLKPQPVSRTAEQEIERRRLPIYYKESEIVDAIQNNLVTVICGETGCGKSTQIPQFLYEAGFAESGMIAVTQPRRLPTIALAKRVATECGRVVGYQVRHQSSTYNRDQKIKFMTDGILVNELGSDALLQQYSVIIIDEAHERKVNTDILIAVLARIVLARGKTELPPLRLVIMSATLRLEDFTTNKQVFPRGVRVITVETRQFPVINYFSKRTKDDFVEEAIAKCIKIHEKLPAGDILIFLTGQKEILNCCKRLEERLLIRKKVENNASESPQQNNVEVEDVNSEFEEEEEVNEENRFSKADNQELRGVAGKQKKLMSHTGTDLGLDSFVVYPLFSKLDYVEQERVFKNAEWHNRRMIVVATNVAETSITIPTIRYVIDSGKFKKKVTNPTIGLSKHYITWISQAAAGQRSGRAGRTGPGYCYRLYTSAVFTNLFEKYNPVEILESPLQSVVLNLKNIGVRNIFHLPFLSPPPQEGLKEALDELLALGAVERRGDRESEFDQTHITRLGQVLSSIPLSPRFAKLLLQARSEKILHYGLLLVCVFSVEEIIKRDSFELEVAQVPIEPTFEGDSEDDLHEFKGQIKRVEQESKQQRLFVQGLKQQFRTIKEFLKGFAYAGCQSDLIPLINLVGMMISAIVGSKRNRELDLFDLDGLILSYCQSHHLLFQSAKELYHNFMQIVDILATLLSDKEEYASLEQFFHSYRACNRDEASHLIQLIVRSSNFKFVCRQETAYNPEKQLYTKHYQSQSTLTKQYIHPSSILSGSSPEFLLYTQMLEIGQCMKCVFYMQVMARSYLFNVTAIEDRALLYHLDTRSPEDKRLRYDQTTLWYDEASDTLKCSCSAVVGCGWQLTNVPLPYPPSEVEYYALFAQLLLKGDIVPFFRAMQKLYRYKPSQIKLSNMQLYSQAIINALSVNTITSRKLLVSKWAIDPRFLLKEIFLIVDEKYHQNVSVKWPPTN